MQEVNKEITKTLVLHRIRRRKRKNTPSRHILVRKRINTKMMAIRLCIYRRIRQRKNNHVYNKIYAKNKPTKLLKKPYIHRERKRKTLDNQTRKNLS